MLLLDTHAWIWWAAGSKKLPARVRRRVDQAGSLGVSAISCWELAMLVRRGRLRLDRDVGSWIAQALTVPGVRSLAVDAEIALAAAQLPDFGGDPADRMLVATVLSHQAKLVSADARIAESGLVSVVW